MRPVDHFRRAAFVALLCLAGAATSLHAEAPAAGSADPFGELIGELMFLADLLNSLDRLCPRKRPARDWHAALPTLPPAATTLELLDLSRRLGADAGRQLVRDQGGCSGHGYAAAYAESRQSFGELVERWQRL